MAMCGAIKSNGMPCRAQVQTGFTRCRRHGAGTPLAKVKAEQALAHARLPACEALFDIIDMWERDVCPICNYPSGDTDMLKTIIRASQVILDRAGMGPRATIEMVKQTDGDLDFDLMTDEEIAELDSLLGQLKQLKTTVHARIAAAVHDLPPAALAGVLVQEVP